MILDKQNLVSDSQAVTATAYSTHTIDLSVARDIGHAKDVRFVVVVPEAATAAGAATVNIQVVTSANANLSSHTVLVETGALGKAEFTLGRRPIVLEIPKSVLLALPLGERYLGLRYEVATGPLTAGKFTAGLTNVVQDSGKNYAGGFSVL